MPMWVVKKKKKKTCTTVANFSARPNLLILNTATLEMFVSQDRNTPKSIKLVLDCPILQICVDDSFFLIPSWPQGPGRSNN